MVRIAIVEDEEAYIQEIMDYLKRYEEEYKEKLSIAVFHDGDEIAAHYNAQFDIILMDIQMGFMDGMAAAEEIREWDKEVVIIFITNMAQYVVRGYQVDALDYILKPITYFGFSQTLQKAVNKIKRQTSIYLSVPVKGGIYKMNLSSLLYVESQGHTLDYHMQDEVICARGNMADVEKELEGLGFFRINKGCIVNLKYVDVVLDNNCVLDGEVLPVARARKKQLLKELTEYIREVVK